MTAEEASETPATAERDGAPASKRGRGRGGRAGPRSGRRSEAPTPVVEVPPAVEGAAAAKEWEARAETPATLATESVAGEEVDASDSNGLVGQLETRSTAYEQMPPPSRPAPRPNKRKRDDASSKDPSKPLSLFELLQQSEVVAPVLIELELTRIASAHAIAADIMARLRCPLKLSWIEPETELPHEGG